MTIWTHHLQAVAFVPSKHKRAGLTFQKRIVSVCFGSMVFLVFVESVVVAKLTFNFDNEDYADSDLLHYSQVARSALWGFMALLSLIIGIWLFQQVGNLTTTSCISPPFSLLEIENLHTKIHKMFFKKNCILLFFICTKVFLSKSTQAKGVYRKLARTDSANTTETLRFLEKKVIMQRRSRDLLVLSVIFWLSLTLRACAFVFQRSLYDYIAAVNFSLAFTVEIIPTIVASQILVHRAHQTSSTTKNELLTRLLPPRSSVAQTIPSPTRLSKLNPIRTSFSLSPPRSSIASVNTMTSL